MNYGRRNIKEKIRTKENNPFMQSRRYKTYHLFLIIESSMESIYVWTDGRFVVSYMNIAWINKWNDRIANEKRKKWFQVQFEWHMSYSCKIQRSSFTLRMRIHREKSDVASKLLPPWAFAILYEKNVYYVFNNVCASACACLVVSIMCAFFHCVPCAIFTASRLSKW